MNILGLLGGMSVFHLIVVLGVLDKTTFLKFYPLYARRVNAIFLIFANIGVVLCYAITLIYQQKLSDMKKNMDTNTPKFKHYYTVSSITLCLMFIPWANLFYLSNYTNAMHYRAPSGITDKQLLAFRILYIISHICYLVAWCLSSSIADAHEDICLEPEYDEYNDYALEED